MRDELRGDNKSIFDATNSRGDLISRQESASPISSGSRRGGEIPSLRGHGSTRTPTRRVDHVTTPKRRRFGGVSSRRIKKSREGRGVSPCKGQLWPGGNCPTDQRWGVGALLSRHLRQRFKSSRLKGVSVPAEDSAASAAPDVKRDGRLTKGRIFHSCN